MEQIEQHQPNIRLMLDVSTGHLKQSTRAFLESAATGASFVLGRTGFGWFTTVPQTETEAERADFAAMYPDDLMKIWDYARSIGVGYVLIDSDAPYLEALPIYPDDPAENGAPITDPYEAAARAAGWEIRGDTFVHDNGDVAHDDLGTISPQADDAWKLVCQLGGIDINDRRAK